jgi:hypothetical protein
MSNVTLGVLLVGAESGFAFVIAAGVCLYLCICLWLPPLAFLAGKTLQRYAPATSVTQYSPAGGDCPGLNAAIRGIGKAARDLLRHAGHRLPQRLPRPGQGPDARTRRRHAFRHPHRRRHHPRHQPRQAAPHAHRRQGARHDRRRWSPPTTATISTPWSASAAAAPRKTPCACGSRPPVVTLPKTIDNDIALTDRSSASTPPCGIATEAIDRLHSTATSHERIIVVEVMGHRAGWLALEAGHRRRRGCDPAAGACPTPSKKIAEAIRAAPGAASASASWSWPRARCPRKPPPRWKLVERATRRTPKKDARRFSAKLRSSTTTMSATPSGSPASSKNSPARNRASPSSATCSAAARPRRRPGLRHLAGHRVRRCAPSQARRFLSGERPDVSKPSQVGDAVLVIISVRAAGDVVFDDPGIIAAGGLDESDFTRGGVVDGISRGQR